MSGEDSRGDVIRLNQIRGLEGKVYRQGDTIEVLRSSGEVDEDGWVLDSVGDGGSVRLVNTAIQKEKVFDSEIKFREFLMLTEIAKVFNEYRELNASDQLTVDHLINLLDRANQLPIHPKASELQSMISAALRSKQSIDHQNSPSVRAQNAWRSTAQANAREELAVENRQHDEEHKSSMEGQEEERLYQVLLDTITRLTALEAQNQSDAKNIWDKLNAICLENSTYKPPDMMNFAKKGKKVSECFLKLSGDSIKIHIMKQGGISGVTYYPEFQNMMDVLKIYS
ncbi:MAG: hypothetical protein HYV41_03370 [Candidatus Magasanikbacteria bacterium]|nr:hypothetical protein [Candidatus Magasanikbacteria bacterium]